MIELAPQHKTGLSLERVEIGLRGWAGFRADLKTSEVCLRLPKSEQEQR